MPSIPTIGSFDPPTTTANEGALAEQAQTLMDHSGRIIGRGSEVAAQMEATAVDFSELVAAPLKQHGGFSLEASRRAMEGAVWGSSVTEQWSADVTAFKETIAALEAEWAAAVASNFGLGAGADPAAVAAAGQAKLAEMNSRANAAYELFKTQAAAAGRMLTGGPSPANLQALAASAGGASWAMFNVFGPMAAPNVLNGHSGAQLADWLRAQLARGDAISPQVRARLLALQDMLELANGGAALAPNQIGFIEGFLRGLDERSAEVGQLLRNLPDVLASSGLGQADQNLIMAGVGGGILAVSNTRYGGGMDRLPESVQNLVLHYFNNPDFEPGRMSPVMADRISSLGAMFGAATDEGLDAIVGGRDLSAALTFAVADVNAGVTYPAAMGHEASVVVSEDSLLNLLEASTRNTLTNHDLLTGNLVHPGYGDATPEHVLRGVFGRDWSDGGAAAAGLIDWIPEAAVSDDPTRAALGSGAAHALFTTMTRDDVSDSGHWTESPYSFFTDGFGRIDGDPAASLGLANREIARALGDVTTAHLPYFGQENVANDFVWNDDPSQRVFNLDLRTRASVFELVMSDEKAAQRLGSEVYALALGPVSNMHGWEDKGDAHLLATEHGRLIGLLDAGQANLVADKTAAVEALNTEATATDAQHLGWARGGAAILKEAGNELYSKIPGLKTLGTAGKILVRNMLEVPKWGLPLGQTHDLWFASDPASADASAPLDMQRYNELNFAIAHTAVDGMLEGDTRLTVEEVENAAVANGIDPHLVIKGTRLVDSTTTLEEGVNTDEITALYVELLERHGRDELFETYRDVLTGQRSDIGDQTAGN